MGVFGTGLSYANKGVWTAPYAFNGASSKPFTILAWVRDTTGAAVPSMAGGFYGGFGNPASGSYMALQTSGGSAYVDEYDDATTEYFAGAALNTQPGAWLPLVGVFAGASSRTIYVPNGLTASSTTGCFTQSLSMVTLGDSVCSNGNATLPCPATQVMAEFAVWRAALGPGEVALLQAGANPSQVRREALLCHFPLRNSLSDNGPLRMQLTGPVPIYGDHPPVAPARAGWGRQLLRSAGSFVAGPRLVWLD